MGFWDDVLESFQGRVNTSGERRSLIRTYIGDMISHGFNQTESKSLFRQYGYGINDSDFADIYNNILRPQHLSKNLWEYSGDEVIDPDYMSINARTNDKKFRYVYSYGADNLETGNIFQGYAAISSNENLSVEAIQNLIEEQLLSQYKEVFTNFRGITLTKAFYNPLRD